MRSICTALLPAMLLLNASLSIAAEQEAASGRTGETGEMPVGGSFGTVSLATDTNADGLPRCKRNLGTIAIIEPNNQWWRDLNLQNPEEILRRLVLQSGCFTLVERGRNILNRTLDRTLAESGELARGSNIGRGIVRSADYFITPDIVQDHASDAGGIGGAFGGVFGSPLGGLRTTKSEANVSLSVVNARTTAEEALTEGYSRKSEIRFSDDSSNYSGQLSKEIGGGYADTEIGRVIVDAYVDAFQKMVVEMSDLATNQSASNQIAGDAPFLPWPPPYPSSIRDISTNFVVSERLGGYDEQIKAKLQKRGYDSLHYFSVPGGFGLTTEVERIGNDGRPSDDRWTSSKVPVLGNLIQYMVSLVSGETGRFRVFAFIISNQEPVPASYKPTQMDLDRWRTTGKPFLANTTRGMRAASQTKVWLLVYEFVASNNKTGELVATEGSGLSFREHARFLGLK